MNENQRNMCYPPPISGSKFLGIFGILTLSGCFYQWKRRKERESTSKEAFLPLDSTSPPSQEPLFLCFIHMKIGKGTEGENENRKWGWKPLQTCPLTLQRQVDTFWASDESSLPCIESDGLTLKVIPLPWRVLVWAEKSGISSFHQCLKGSYKNLFKKIG